MLTLWHKMLAFHADSTDEEANCFIEKLRLNCLFLLTLILFVIYIFLCVFILFIIEIKWIQFNEPTLMNQLVETMNNL